MKKYKLLGLFSVFWLVFNHSLVAHEAEGLTEKVASAEIVLVPDLEIPVLQLAVQLRPMRKAALEKQMELWLRMLEQQITLTADYTVGSILTN